MKTEEKLLLQIEDLCKRVDRLEKGYEKKMTDKNLQMEVIRLDWKHHGWAGNVEDLAANREQWGQAKEMIDLIKKHLKSSSLSEE